MSHFTAPKIPRGCYATESWTNAFVEGGYREECTQYVRASDGEVMGTLVVTFLGEEFMGEEFVAWDDL